ncbi:hypothetical protein CO165_02230 [Candidatus Roizmanbacteria bacterium CG_4_9_14_3_um_filter_33_18]|uniref:Uncharacterized protein n=1 Tax=Candidatus Roizmanbacteria bacterium CG_4_9_14_3_um_filter_33_18 TaxID=1974841 RepID=A0A2M7XY70_9BACT|nr:MAG: hypothetical protein CO165_02230 [Candidatus Roizmanbacteria bacterium CG_4_9_14_3_um_filter_33_18]
MINQNFIYFGALIFFLGSIDYFVETIKGKVKPNRVTWFLWGLAPMIAFSAQIKQGVGLQSLLTFMVGFVPFLILSGSFINKKSYWKIKKFDLICGFFSIIGLILWQITKIGNIAILFSIIADFIAGWPTFVKSFKFPETENYLIYLGNAIFALLTLLTIKVWSFEYYSFSLYLFVITLIIAVFIKFKVKKLFYS